MKKVQSNTALENIFKKQPQFLSLTKTGQVSSTDQLDGLAVKTLKANGKSLSIIDTAAFERSMISGLKITVRGKMNGNRVIKITPVLNTGVVLDSATLHSTLGKVNGKKLVSYKNGLTRFLDSHRLIETIPQRAFETLLTDNVIKLDSRNRPSKLSNIQFNLLQTASFNTHCANDKIVDLNKDPSTTIGTFIDESKKHQLVFAICNEMFSIQLDENGLLMDGFIKIQEINPIQSAVVEAAPRITPAIQPVKQEELNISDKTMIMDLISNLSDQVEQLKHESNLQNKVNEEYSNKVLELEQKVVELTTPTVDPVIIKHSVPTRTKIKAILSNDNVIIEPEPVVEEVEPVFNEHTSHFAAKRLAMLASTTAQSDVLERLRAVEEPEVAKVEDEDDFEFLFDDEKSLVSCNPILPQQDQHPDISSINFNFGNAA